MTKQRTIKEIKTPPPLFRDPFADNPEARAAYQLELLTPTKETIH